MKMRSAIIMLVYLSMCISPAFANENSKACISLPDVNSINIDTLNSNRFLKVDSFNLSIISPASGVHFYKDGIIYLASSKSTGKMLPEHLSFGTINAAYAVLADSVLEKPQAFSRSSSFPYPCDAVTFSSDYNTMYFTRIAKTGGEKIYKGKFSQGSVDQGEWTLDTDPMSFCSDQYIYTHPALSADGKILVYASNRQGSFGGMDLYVSINKDGNWSNPENLGDAVNSSYNELYPYLDSENNLFFSSDNIQGLGGYDIYVCKFRSNTWEKPINLSNPINTKFDDIAFTIDRKDGKSAFYAVKQNSDKRPSQLLFVRMKSSRSDTILNLSQYFTRPDISQMVILALEPAVQASDIIAVAPAPSGGANDVITYRVQVLTSFNPKTRSQITVNGKDYSVYEYLYSGAYRLCVGEFSTISPALELQSTLMKTDYPNASVVVFRNNVLSLDPALLKSPVVTAQKTAAEQTPVAGAKSTATAAVSATKEVPKPEVKKSEAAKAPVAVTGTKVAAVAAVPVVTTNKKEGVVYRVQIFSGGTGGSTKVKIDNKPYMTYEYSYNGNYRTCVGEFSTLTPAKEFQGVCRKSGFPQAFVVAFKDNVRSTDPALFK